jgi:hypothetical protein
MKKYIPYIIGGAILGTIVYFTFRKSDKPDPKGSETEDEEGQKKVLPDVDAIMKLTPSEATKAAKNKKIFTKTETTNLRTSNYVNDGIINNLFEVVDGSNVLLGEIVEIAIDKGGMTNPSTNRPYKWAKFKLDRNLYDKIQGEKSFLTRNTTFIQYYPWVREDVIKF